MITPDGIAYAGFLLGAIAIVGIVVLVHFNREVVMSQALDRLTAALGAHGVALSDNTGAINRAVDALSNIDSPAALDALTATVTGATATVVDNTSRLNAALGGTPPPPPTPTPPPPPPAGGNVVN